MHDGKSLISVFQEYFASIHQNFYLARGVGLGYHSIKVRDFPNIS